MAFEVVGLDHVQLAMPAGREADAEAFYSGRLGFVRLPKPEPMASRGGCWFQSGAAALHLGVEADFRPARKAHPALIVRDLVALGVSLTAAGIEVKPNPDRAPGASCYVDDPFGNRLELLSVEGLGATPPTNTA